MGLSTISTSLRRRLAPPEKLAKPPPTTPHTPLASFLSLTRLTPRSSSKTISSSPPSPPMRRLRLKDLSAPELLHALSSLDAPASPETTAAVANHIASDSDLLKDAVSHALRPPTLHAPPRARLQSAWVLTALFRHGPNILGDTLSRSPNVIRQFADVFNPDVVSPLDPALASFSASVLRHLLYRHPKPVSTALSSSKIVPHLILHIHLQPAADLLPRFVGTKVFTALTPAPIAPMHKRAIAMMAHHNIQQSLSKVIIDAISALYPSSDQPACPSHLRARNMSAIRNATTAMADISIAAMCLAKKHEDLDERADAMYAGNLSLVTSAVFNDAKKQLDLSTNPRPLLSILDAVFGNEHAMEDSDVLVPVLEVITCLLTWVREAKQSLLPSLRAIADTVDLSGISEGLVCLSKPLSEVLVDGGFDTFVGRKRVAVLDFLRAACATLSRKDVELLVTADAYVLFRRLIEVSFGFRNRDVVLIRVSQILSCLFDGDDALLIGDLLKNTQLGGLLKNVHTCGAMRDAVRNVWKWANKYEKEEEELVKYVEHVVKYYEMNMKHEHDGLVTSLSMGRAAISNDMIRDLGMEGQLGLCEDYGEKIYVLGLLKEVSDAGKMTPPSDDVVSHAVHGMSKGWGKGLASRLQHFYIPGAGR